MTDLAAQVRAAVQNILDAAGDGYQVTQMVICMGLERVVDGDIESTSWFWTPPGQPDWMTAGLIEAALEIREWSRED